jgi:hypothetical protein
MTERTETGGPTRTPRSEMDAVVPAARRESAGVEPVLLWDRSTSTLWSTVPGGADYPDPASRRTVMTEAIRQLVVHLDGLDSEESGEQASGSDEMGGLLTFFFSSGTSHGEDLNPSNFDRKVSAVQWGGGTHIMSAWEQALNEYDEEFGDKPERERPVHLVLIATDGELDDVDDFASKALSTAGAHRIFLVMVFGADGDGEERHSATLSQYSKIASAQQAADPHGKSYIRIVSFDSVTDPQEIAEDMIALVG